MTNNMTNLSKYNITLNEHFMSSNSRIQYVINKNLNHNIDILTGLCKQSSYKGSPYADHQFSPLACTVSLNLINEDAVLFGFDPDKFIHDNFKIIKKNGQIAKMTSKYLSFTQYDSSKLCTIGFLYCFHMDFIDHMTQLHAQLDFKKTLASIIQEQKHRLQSNRLFLVWLYYEMPHNAQNVFFSTLKQNNITTTKLNNPYFHVPSSVFNQVTAKLARLDRAQIYNLTHVASTRALV